MFSLRLNKRYLPLTSWNPDCLQATYAADFLKFLPQTLPHTPLTHTSSRPSLVKVPLTRRTVPSLHSLDSKWRQTMYFVNAEKDNKTTT